MATINKRSNRDYVRHLETIEKLLEEGGGGGGTPDAVKYTAQSLTSSQQQQARTNIGSASASELSQKQDTLVSGTNIKTLNSQSLLGSGNITIDDQSAVKYTEAQSLSNAQKATARGNIAAASLADINNPQYVKAAIRPEASENTMGPIYLIGPDANDEYERYFTQESNGTYSWVALGSTEIHLDGYATDQDISDVNDEISQLDLEVHNLSGKYYGVFEDAESLPEGDAVGYAFVGTEDPFAIYNFNGEEWTDSGATVDGITGEPGVGFSSVSTPTPYDGTVIITLSNGDTITLDLNHNHPAYYSKVLGGAQPVGGFEPDVVYSLGTLSGTITFSLASPVTGNVNHYFWMFDTDSTAPTINWPAGLTWAAGSAPTVAASKHYEISVLNGIAYYSEV